MANPYKTFTTKARILVYLRVRQPNYISGTELESQAREWATKSSVITRRARELVNEGKIQRKMVNGCVWYRLTQSEPRTFTTLEANSYLQSLDKESEREKQGTLWEHSN